LQYVRVWHGGAIVGANNEINGITFGGVGSGTVVDHCEVAFNLDDGFEFFGGTVNVKYLSVLFVADDGFDTDQGYIGKGQFLFVIEGLSGDHSMEIDSGVGSNQDVTPRSHPAFYSFTLIGGGTGTGARTGELIHVNDGTGGKFGNGILAYPNGNGLLFEDCGSTLSYTQTLPAASVSISNPGYFYFSANNIIDTATTASQFALHTGTTSACTPADTWTAVSGAPGFAAVATTDLAEGSATFNPLPSATGAACTGTKDAPPNGDAFFSSVSCKGAFGSATDNWLAGYSWLACSGKMAGRTCTGIPASPFATLQSTVTLVPSTIASNTVLAASTSYIHASQVFVQSGVTLTIPAGTTIFALPVPTGIPAPALVVLKGGMLMATGSATMPITFKSVLAE